MECPLRRHFGPTSRASLPATASSTTRTGRKAVPTKPVTSSTNVLNAWEITRSTSTTPGQGPSGLLHARGPTPPSLPTPIRSDAVFNVLRHYHDRDFLHRGLVWGFTLGFDGVECATLCVNSSSFDDHYEAGLEKVMSEVALGRIAGPFPYPPLPLFKCSP